MHSDIVNDKQLESSKPRLKDKSCNVISLSQEDDIATITSLSSFGEEKFALAVQPTISQSIGTQSGRQYLRQYDQTLDVTQ